MEKQPGEYRPALSRLLEESESKMSGSFLCPVFPFSFRLGSV